MKSVLVEAMLARAGSRVVLQNSFAWAVARQGLGYGHMCWGCRPPGIASAFGWVAERSALGTGQQSWSEDTVAQNSGSSMARVRDGLHSD